MIKVVRRTIGANGGYRLDSLIIDLIEFVDEISQDGSLALRRNKKGNTRTVKIDIRYKLPW